MPGLCATLFPAAYAEKTRRPRRFTYTYADWTIHTDPFGEDFAALDQASRPEGLGGATDRWMNGPAPGGVMRRARRVFSAYAAGNIPTAYTHLHKRQNPTPNKPF